MLMAKPFITWISFAFIQSGPNRCLKFSTNLFAPISVQVDFPKHSTRLNHYTLVYAQLLFPVPQTSVTTLSYFWDGFLANYRTNIGQLLRLFWNTSLFKKKKFGDTFGQRLEHICHHFIPISGHSATDLQEETPELETFFSVKQCRQRDQ